MLKRLSAREQIAILLDQYSLAIRSAFLEAVADIASRLTLTMIVARLEKGDISGAVEAVGIERAAFNPVLDEIAKAYSEGGNFEAGNMTFPRSPEGHRVLFRFDVRNLRAENWLRQHSAQLVTNIVEDQRTAIRTALTEGLARGINPRVTALDIVGRIDRATGTRTGGLIGLTGQQSQAIANARQRLVSGDPASMREYLGLARRDRRFDKTVLAAIEAEKPVPAEMVTRIVGRYADRLLQLRGEVIGQHETFTALGAARREAYEQAIEAGTISRTDVRKTWRHFPSEHERLQHVAMTGKEIGFDEAFVMADGTRLQYPHDPAAPASHTLGCKCQADYRIDYVGQFIRRRAA